MAVEADQADALVLGHVEVDAVEHLQRPIAGREAAHRERGAHAASPASSKYALRTIGQVEDLVGGSRGDHAAGVEHDHALGDREQQLEAVLDDHDRAPSLLDDAADDGVDLVDLVGQQAGARLVHQQHAGGALQQAGQQQLAPLERVQAAREGTVGRSEPDQLARVRDGLGRDLRAVGVARRSQRLADAQRRGHERCLERAPEPEPRPPVRRHAT